VDSTTTGVTRTYPTLTASLDEVLQVRIWSGLHFRHSMRDGATVGRNAATWAAIGHFLP
jgi:hypothetical protein